MPKFADLGNLSLEAVLNELAVANPITIHAESSLTDALQILGKECILSAPVVDDTGRCIGLIDVLDCVAFAVNIYYSNTSAEDSQPSQFKNTVMQFAFQVQTVRDAMDLSHHNPFHPTQIESTSVLSILEKFARGVHRVPIVDSEGRVSHIITQSNMFSFLFPAHKITERGGNVDDENKEDWSFLQSTVDELKVGFREMEQQKLKAVLETTIAMDAFKQIYDQGVSAVGILDANGKKLIGNVSASDLVGFIGEADVNYLGESVTTFQEHVKKKKGQKQRSLAFCKPEHSIAEVIRRMQLAGRVHRIYIMNDQMKPVGLISYTDLFQLIYEQCKRAKAATE